MPMLHAIQHPRILVALEWYDHEVHYGVVQYARQAGWILNDAVAHLGKVPPAWRGEGIIAVINNATGEVARLVRHCRRPVVDLTNEVPALKVPRVLADNFAIGRVGAEHLISRGFRHLAFVCVWGSWVETERMQGFERAVRKAGRDFHLLDFQNAGQRFHVDETERMRGLVRQITRLPRPVGIMAQYDSKALWVLQACEVAGLRVPDEVAVVGADNDVLSCEAGPMPLSSVERRRREHGYQAAALLDRLMHGEKPPAEPIRVAPGPVVARRSSDVLAVDDPAVAAALRFIAENYQRPDLGVTDVVHAAGLDRQERRLYRLFTAQVGTPIKAQILRHRVNHARQLLLTSQDKLLAIAHRAGFRDGEHLTRAFKRELGIAPGHFRCATKEAAPTA